MEKIDRFLKFYLYLAIVNGFAIILSTFLPLLQPLYLSYLLVEWIVIVFSITTLLVIFGFFFTSFYAFARFIKRRQNKILLLIPIVNVITVPLSWFLTLSTYKYQWSLYGIYSSISGIIINLFYIIFGYYLLKRYGGTVKKKRSKKHKK